MDEYGLSTLVNENWEKNWKDIISTDYDFDSDYLIRLITHKLKLMMEYAANKYDEFEKGRFNTDIDLILIITQTHECYELGKKILTYKYSEAADNYFKEHDKMSWIAENKRDKEFREWDKLVQLADKERMKDVKEFYSLLAKNSMNWCI